MRLRYEKGYGIIGIREEQLRSLLLYPKLVNAEVSGMGDIVETSDGNLLITKIFLIKNDVNQGSYTRLDYNALLDTVQKYMNEGKDPSRLRVWWHSHYNFSVGFSGTDEATINRIIRGSPWFVSICVNQIGDIAARLDFDKPFRMTIPLKLEIIRDEHKLVKKLQDEVKRLVAGTQGSLFSEEVLTKSIVSDKIESVEDYNDWESEETNGESELLEANWNFRPEPAREPKGNGGRGRRNWFAFGSRIIKTRD